jgi:hypothetical protein
MAGTGRKVCFHGSFATKEKARQKEGETPGAFIREIVLHGKPRYVVLSDRGSHPGRSCDVSIRL